MRNGKLDWDEQIPKEGGSEMTFDKDRVLTPFTAHRAEVGSYGFFGEGVRDIENEVKGNDPCRLSNVTSNALPFVNEYYVEYEYFYPAPYEYMQARWVEEVRLKVGDKVRITRKWKRGEREFDYTCPLFEVGKTFKVNLISEHYLVLCHETERRFSNVGAVPYFVLEKVTETHRPFANAEEFKPHRDEWFSWTGGFEEEAYRVTAYGDDYVELGGERISYKQFSRQWRFSTTGEPAGVKL